WVGHYADTHYESLHAGPAIIRELIARVRTSIFRPHPFRYRNRDPPQRLSEHHRRPAGDTARTGRRHLHGRPPQEGLDAFGCFNAADAMISDVSSVVPDFLYSGKPYGLVTMTSTIEDFEEAFPLARSAYVIDRDLSTLNAALDELLVHDSKAEQRKATREYYLGPFAPENYADAFVDAARHVILHERKPVAALNAPSEGDEGPLEAAGSSEDSSSDEASYSSTSSPNSDADADDEE